MFLRLIWYLMRQFSSGEKLADRQNILPNCLKSRENNCKWWQTQNLWYCWSFWLMAISLHFVLKGILQVWKISDIWILLILTNKQIQTAKQSHSSVKDKVQTLWWRNIVSLFWIGQKIGNKFWQNTQGRKPVVAQRTISIKKVPYFILAWIIFNFQAFFGGKKFPGLFRILSDFRDWTQDL